MRNKAIACLGAIVACATALAGIPATAMADDSAGLTPNTPTIPRTITA